MILNWLFIPKKGRKGKGREEGKGREGKGRDE